MTARRLDTSNHTSIGRRTPLGALRGWFTLGAGGNAFDPVEVSVDTEWTTLRGAGLEVVYRSAVAHHSQRGGTLFVGLNGGKSRHSESRFAEIALDMQARRAVLKVDRFAVVPLCFTVAGQRLAFSDRADEVPGVRPDQVDLQALYDYVYFHVIPAPRTIYAGVNRVPAAESVEVSRGGITSSACWKPSFAPKPGLRFEDRKRQFVDLLFAAVEQEATVGEIGTFLSGGTDSSTVTGLLRRAVGRRIPAFSIGFQAEGYDEIAYARIAARHFDVDHHEYYVTPEDLIEHIPVVAAHYDQPFGNSSALPAYICARHARTHGLDRILAGDGGDELFGGNVRYAKQKVFAAYEVLPAVLRRRILEPFLQRAVALGRVPPIRKLASYVEQARIPMPDRTETYNLLERFGPERVFSAAVLADVDRTGPLELERKVYAESDGNALVNRMLAFDWRFTLADTDLPKVVGTTSLAGLDVGFPMLDDPVVDFSLGLPPEFKLRGLKLRWFFKEALREFLPPQIIRKSKHGFGLPFGPWLVKHEPLRQFAENALHRLAGRGVLAESLVDDLFSVHLKEHPGYYGEMIWILMMLEYWFGSHAPDFVVKH